MGTETRIGIAAGLLIVIIASVYFFYGSDRSDEDLTIALGPGAAEAPRIPSAEERKPAPSRAKKKTLPRRRTPGAVTKPPRPAGNRAARSDRPRPGRTPIRTTPGTPVNGRKPARTDRTGRPPVGRPAKAAARSAARGPGSGERLRAAGQTGRRTPLRTPPSPDLVNATRNNLRRAGAAAKPGAQSGQEAGGAAAEKDAEKTPAKAAPESSAAAPAKAAPEAGRPARPAPAERPTPAVRRPGPRPAVSPGSRRTGRVTPAAKRVERTAPPAGPWPKRHRVSFDETLSGISLRYYDTSTMVDHILGANPRVKDPRKLRPGEVLVIPAPPDTTGTPATAATSAASKGRAGDRPSGNVYLVQRGDTFYSIAGKMLGDSSRWKELFERNREIVKNDPKRLRPGMRLTLPERKRSGGASSRPNA